jgi:hypothetical protein
MAAHRISNHLTQFFQGVSLRENIVSQGAGLIPALRRFLNRKDDLGFFHDNQNYTEITWLDLSYVCR